MGAMDGKNGSEYVMDMKSPWKKLEREDNMAEWAPLGS